ncbi:MAG: hypothetical protein FJW34_16940 [Acidobacteria bacterium]|nr:hypothetical protein [Acidobacteriota bacterium]
MHDDLLRDVDFWQFLLGIDREFAQNARKNGCSCGGRLHAGNYLRKPRGGPDGLPEECCLRLSFCCCEEGCRKRLTPPSVRFLGPKVYLLSVIFLAAAMRQGPSPRTMRELCTLFGADRRTIARWQLLWQEHFPQTRFWKVERARLPHPNEATLLPRALMVAFFISPDAPRDDWVRLLCFLAPITVADGLAVAIGR